MQAFIKSFVNGAFWRRSMVLLVLQSVLTALVLLLAWIGGTDLMVVKTIRFMLTAPALEIKQFYPHYYRHIYVIAQLITYGIPTFLLAIGLYAALKRKARLGKWLSLWQEDALAWPHVHLPLLAAFAMLLLSYFGLTPFMQERFEFQLLLTRFFLAASVLHVLLLLAANAQRVKRIFSDYLFQNQLPYSLAGTRILFALFLIFTYLESYGKHAQNIGALQKVGLPYIGWLIELVPVNPQLFAFFCFAGMVCGLFIAVGFQTRLFLILNAIVVFYVIAAPNFFGKLWHSQIIIWISWILAFSPCYAVWSIDSKRKGLGADGSNANYGFHLKVIWLHFGLIYFFAGVHKLSVCGLDWALTDSMVSQVQIEWFEHYDKVPGFRIDRWPVFLMVSGLAVIFFEICYPFLLFGKKTRWLSIIGGLFMHKALGRIMYIAFEQLQACYLVFIPWNNILVRLKKVNPSKPKLSIPDYRSATVVLPLLILSINFLFGTFIISSYPFSVYPIYAEIVPPTVKYFDYRVLDKDKQAIDFREEGRKQNFRWESYSRLEYYTIRKFEGSGKLDSNEVRTQWKRWQLAVPALATVDSVEVHIVERSLIPEKADVRLSDQYLMNIGQ